MTREEENEIALVFMISIAWDKGYRQGYDYGWCEGNEGKPHNEDLITYEIEGTELMAALAAAEILHG